MPASSKAAKNRYFPRKGLTVMFCAVSFLFAGKGAGELPNPFLPPPASASIARPLDPLGILAEGIIRVYQNAPKKPSSIGRCPFSPSCSRFALEALHRHGAVAAAFLTADRLFFREHQGLEKDYVSVPTENGPRFLDSP